MFGLRKYIHAIFHFVILRLRTKQADSEKYLQKYDRNVSRMVKMWQDHM